MDTFSMPLLNFFFSAVRAVFMIFYANNFQNLLTFKVVLEKASSALTDTFVFATVIARGFQERQQQAAK